MTQLTDGQAKYLAEAQARFQLPEFTDEQLIGELVKRGVLQERIEEYNVWGYKGRRFVSGYERVQFHCKVADTKTEAIPWQCESGSSFAPGHESDDWEPVGSVEGEG